MIKKTTLIRFSLNVMNEAPRRFQVHLQEVVIYVSMCVLFSVYKSLNQVYNYRVKVFTCEHEYTLTQTSWVIDLRFHLCNFAETKNSFQKPQVKVLEMKLHLLEISNICLKRTFLSIIFTNGLNVYTFSDQPMLLLEILCRRQLVKYRGTKSNQYDNRLCLCRSQLGNPILKSVLTRFFFMFP